MQVVLIARWRQSVISHWVFTLILKHLKKTKTFWLSACHSASGNATSVLGKRSEMFRMINSLTVWLCDTGGWSQSSIYPPRIGPSPFKVTDGLCSGVINAEDKFDLKMTLFQLFLCEKIGHNSTNKSSEIATWFLRDVFASFVGLCLWYLKWERERERTRTWKR